MPYDPTTDLFNDPTMGSNFLAWKRKKKLEENIGGQGNFGEDQNVQSVGIPRPDNERNYLRSLALERPPDTHSEYWKKPIVGKMPRDQFVQAMGALANVFDPKSGRGNALLDIGGQAYGERMKREYTEPENMLRRRALVSGIIKSETPKMEKPEYTRLKALKEIGNIDYKLARVAKSNTVLGDSQALEMARILGRPVSEGSLLDEESRLKYIDSLTKQRNALLPFTRTLQENIAYDTPLSEEEKKNIYKETYGLMKSGGEKASDIMPDPTQFKGRTGTDSLTGKRYISDGIQWKVIP